FWVAAANRAMTVHLRGDRDRARALFDELVPALPAPGAPYRNALEENGAARVFEIYGGCLVAEGRPAAAVAWLARAEHGSAKAPTYPQDLPHARGLLGEALDETGDAAAARASIESSLQGYLATYANDDPAVLAARERWGRFLFAHGDAAAA